MRFRLLIEEVKRYRVEVEAESEEESVRKAAGMILNGDLECVDWYIESSAKEIA